MASLQITAERTPPGQPSYLYVIAYRDTDRQRAKDVVQSLLEIFVESSVGDKRKTRRARARSWTSRSSSTTRA